LNLVYAREATDVTLAVSLAALEWDNMTAFEKALWMGDVGYLSCLNGYLECTDGRLTFDGEGVNYGLYGPVDWNRVETAVDEISELLQALPAELEEYAADHAVAWDDFYVVPYDPDEYIFTVKTDWARDDVPTPAQMTRYRTNVVRIIQALAADYPTLPAYMDGLTYSGANALEYALYLLYNAFNALETQTKNNIDNAVTSWIYSGEFAAGEV